MKSKYWAILLAGILVLCLIPVLLPFSHEPVEMAQIKSGDMIIPVNLHENQSFTLESENGGYNTVTVKDGKIAVTDADCPDHYCMERGFCNSGTPIVCLPHKLVIEFVEEQEIDGLIG